jgi:hypothetical protein
MPTCECWIKYGDKELKPYVHYNRLELIGLTWSWMLFLYRLAVKSFIIQTSRVTLPSLFLHPPRSIHLGPLAEALADISFVHFQMLPFCLFGRLVSRFPQDQLPVDSWTTWLLIEHKFIVVIQTFCFSLFPFCYAFYACTTLLLLGLLLGSKPHELINISESHFFLFPSSHGYEILDWEIKVHDFKSPWWEPRSVQDGNPAEHLLRQC